MKKCLILLLAILPSVALSESLGRLFFTPRQRAMMDSLTRNQGKPVQKGEDGKGMVEKKGGGKTIWVEGVPRHVEGQKK